MDLPGGGGGRRSKQRLSDDLDILLAGSGGGGGGGGLLGRLRRQFHVLIGGGGGGDGGGVRVWRAVGAAACVLAAVLLWVGEAEILQLVQSDSSASHYDHPYFISWFVHNGYCFFVPVWLIYARRRRRADQPISREHIARVVKVAIILAPVLTLCGWLWCLSLPRTSVSANTAIYQSSCVFVFILSSLLLPEVVFTLPKVASVALAVAGVVVVTLTDEPVSEKGVAQTYLGYVYVVASTVLYAAFEVLYKVAGRHQESVMDAFLFLGVNGVASLVLCWPMIVILHIFGIETFALPDAATLQVLCINLVMDSALNACILMGITLSSPLVVSVGVMMTIPASIACDWAFHSYALSAPTLAGVAVIVLAFITLNASEYCCDGGAGRRSSSRHNNNSNNSNNGNSSGSGSKRGGAVGEEDVAEEEETASLIKSPI